MRDWMRVLLRWATSDLWLSLMQMVDLDEGEDGDGIALGMGQEGLILSVKG